MRLSLLAARPAAFIHPPCASSLVQASRPSTRLYRPFIIHVRRSVPHNARQYGASPPLRKLRTTLSDENRRGKDSLDPTALKALDAAIEDDPKRVLSEQERGLRDAHRKQSFVNLMRTVPNPVAIVTTQRQDIEDPKDDFLMGATVSSFKSVCVEPEPYVSFNLSSLSRTYKNIKDHKYFCVTIPQNDNAGQRLARTFTHRSPKEALKGQPDGSKVEKHRWNLALEGGMPCDMKYPPPAVRTSNIKGAKTNGIAFAFLCEYHASIVVGDHVVITGRVLPASFASASPWGNDHEYGNTFASNDMTLGYVHGHYGNPEHFGGIDQSWKADDPYVTAPTGEEKRDKLLEALNFFESRLELIEDVLKNRNGHSQSKPHQRARLIRRERLIEYQKYYQSRALEYYNILRVLEQRSDSSSENSLDIVNKIMELHGTSSLNQPEDPPLRTQAVLRKSLLSNDQLEQEEKLYLARLEALESSEEIDGQDSTGQSEQVQPHQSVQKIIPVSETPDSQTTNSSHTLSAVSDSLESADNTSDRREQLIKHFKDNLSLVRKALKMRVDALVQPSVPKTYSAPTSPEEQKRMVHRFLGAKRKAPLVDLLSEYRRYQVQITETRLARIQCMYQKDQYDEKILQVLEERLAYFEQRLDLISQVISERYEDLDQAQLSKGALLLERKPNGNKTKPGDAAEHEQAETVTKQKQEQGIDRNRPVTVRHFRPRDVGEDEGEPAGTQRFGMQPHSGDER